MKKEHDQNRRSFIQKGLLLTTGSLLVPGVFGSINRHLMPARGGNIKYVTVAAKEGRFFGWPANNGMWKWDKGKEILVGFTNGPFEEQDGHNIGHPQLTNLARSKNGGKTWKREDPDHFVGDGGEPEPSPGDIHFGHPDFALRVAALGYHGTDDDQGRFFISYDRGRRWMGPYRFNQLNADKNLQGAEITARTNYLVTGENSIQIFMAARKRGIEYGSRLDKAFVVESTDGGKTFHFLQWAVPWTDQYRAVMPSVVRTQEGNLVMAIRRRNPRDNDQPCWIDVFVSGDNGRSWSFLSKVGDTGLNNGNPPGLAILDDGRLACCYANRSRRQLLIRFSDNGGAGWGEERVVRDNPHTYDMGYPQLLQNHEGEMVALYYIATEDRPHSYIEAAIWQV